MHDILNSASAGRYWAAASTLHSIMAEQIAENTATQTDIVCSIGNNKWPVETANGCKTWH